MAKSVIMSCAAITLVVAIFRTHGIFTTRYIEVDTTDTIIEDLQLASAVTDGFLCLMSMVLLGVAGISSTPHTRICAAVPWFLSVMAALGIDLAYSLKKITELHSDGEFDDMDVHRDVMLTSWATGCAVYVLMFVFVVLSLIQESRNKNPPPHKPMMQNY